MGSSLAASSSGTPDWSADKWDQTKQDLLNGAKTASLGGPDTPMRPWSGDGEVMQDFDPNQRLFKDDYAYDNRSDIAFGSTQLDADPTMQRVVVTGKRLPAEEQESWYKYQMRASMPDFGRKQPVTKASTPAPMPAVSRLGSLSMKYETRMSPSDYRRAAGVVSSGKGDPGGISYGAYQLASNVGKVQDFLKNDGLPWASRFEGMDPAVKGDFGQTWKAIAAVPSDDFFNAQHAYIEESNFNPVAEYLRKKTGLDISTQPIAVQDAIWSASVQHGGAKIFLKEAIDSVQVSRSSPEYSETLLNTIYEKRINYVNGIKQMDSNTKSNLVTIRYPDELSRALQMLKK